MEFYHSRDTGRHRLLVRSIMEKVCPVPFFATRVAGRGGGGPILISGWWRILRFGLAADFWIQAGWHTPDTWLTHTRHTLDTVAGPWSLGPWVPGTICLDLGTLFCHEWGVLEVWWALSDTGQISNSRSTILGCSHVFKWARRRFLKDVFAYLLENLKVTLFCHELGAI